MTPFDITKADTFKKMEIMETLRTVVDPELNINIVDLGLIYSIELDEKQASICVIMTLSSQHCPVGEAIVHTVKNSVEHNFSGYNVEVNLTWEPKWTYENITEEGLKQLRG